MGDDPQSIREGFLDNGGMVRRGLKEGGHAVKKLVPLMHDARDLAMHQPRGPFYPRAKGMGDTLVPEANAKDGYLPVKVGYGLVGDPGVSLWPARARRDDKMGRFQGRQLLYSDGIVAKDARFHTEFSQVLHEIVGKGIIVIDHDYHLPPPVSQFATLGQQ
jgi:hypothetical protein